MLSDITLHQRDRCYHKILWRENQTDAIHAYELNTVTYSTACASFLAIRSLHELAELNRDKFEHASNVIKRDFYANDFLSGSFHEESTKILREQVETILNSGGFQFRKWASNNPNVLDGIDHLSDDKIVLSHDSIKTLGIFWSPNHDFIHYSVPIYSEGKSLTKRKALSIISQIFDPMGLIGPIILKGKIIMQQIWNLKLGWDDQLPNNIHDDFISYIRDIHLLNELSIKRKLSQHSNSERMELHCFCDASEKAYAASIYLISIHDGDKRYSNLVCAKSKVAPLKVVTLPRLELSGALLLARLLHKVKAAISLNIPHIYCWTDSTIVLARIRAPSRTWKTLLQIAFLKFSR